MGTCLGRKTVQDTVVHDPQDFAPIKHWAVINPRPSAQKAAPLATKGNPIPSHAREPSYPAPTLPGDPNLPTPITCLQMLITMQEEKACTNTASSAASPQQLQTPPRQRQLQRRLEASPEPSPTASTPSVGDRALTPSSERRHSRSASSELPERTYSFSTVSTDTVNSDATSSGSLGIGGAEVVSPPKYTFPLGKSARQDSYVKGRPLTAGEFLGRIKKGMKQPNQQRQESRGIELVKGYKRPFASWPENESLLSNSMECTS